MTTFRSAGWLSVLLMLCSIPVSAQVYGGLDDCGGGYGNNGFRIYFDETVDASCGGIIESPAHWALSMTATPMAYLVLINPTVVSLNLWQCDLRIEGQGEVTGSFFFGNPAANLGTGDTYVVFFNEPMPLLEDHVPLARFDLSLEEGSNPEGLPFGFMDFFIAPATGEDQDAPGYFSPGSTFHTVHSLTSNYHGWDAPCMRLNSLAGVTDSKHSSWGHLKALYR